MRKLRRAILLFALLMAALFVSGVSHARADTPILSDIQTETLTPTESLAEETVQTSEETQEPTSEQTICQEPESLPAPETEETLPPEDSAAAQGLSVITPIARLSGIPFGSEGVSIRGTVVLLAQERLVVQDDSGGILLMPEPPYDGALGDILLITGRKEGTFLAQTLQKEGTGALPVVEMPLSDAPEALRILVKNAVVKDGVISQNGAAIPVRGDALPEGNADVCGVILDGILYADSVIPVAPPESPKREWNVYFGLLHAHTEASDGIGTVQEAFAAAAEAEGLDFFAVTDHSDSLDNSSQGEITADGTAISARWAEGRRAAAQVTGRDFVGLYGYEMSWGEDRALGHINTFRTPGWQSWQQPGFSTLSEYYAALAKVPAAVSQFNHPGTAYGEFRGFREYHPDYDAVMHLLEIEGENGASYYGQYLRALDAGWHVAPSAGENNHHGNWGRESSTRTAVLAKTLTEDALCQAMQRRRVYVTQDSDLTLEYRLNGTMMGSVMGLADALEVDILLEDPTDGSAAAVEVVSSGGAVVASCQMEANSAQRTLPVPSGYPYYFLRIVQPDGDTAITAPVWVDSFTDMGIRSFSCDTPNLVAGQAVTLCLELYNYEEVPFRIDSVTLLRGEEPAGTFTSAGQLCYRADFLWQEPGQVQLTAVVRGSVDGRPRSYRQSLTLHYCADSTQKASIAAARGGQAGQVYTVQGYATSGTTNPYTTFPNTVYMQDTSGGIAVFGEFPDTIQIGTPLEITGVLRDGDNGPYLELIGWEILSKPMYRYVPEVLNCKSAMDYTRRGGCLVQIEGRAVSLTATADGKGLSRILVQDALGNTAAVVIDPEIRSGAYGVNHLASRIKQARTVRAIGLVHREASGEIVLRVRNCDEVVYVPPIPDRTNPQTGDFPFLHCLRGLGIFPGNTA